ncbi:MAG: hypothetical protein J7L92_00215, partial [Dehalococcoidia bacterium]|nr:hypothetical protein [Dehalococcoidia bacterium]
IRAGCRLSTTCEILDKSNTFDIFHLRQKYNPRHFSTAIVFISGEFRGHHANQACYKSGIMSPEY